MSSTSSSSSRSDSSTGRVFGVFLAGDQGFDFIAFDFLFDDDLGVEDEGILVFDASGSGAPSSGTKCDGARPLPLVLFAGCSSSESSRDLRLTPLVVKCACGLGGILVETRLVFRDQTKVHYHLIRCVVCPPPDTVQRIVLNSGTSKSAVMVS